MAMAMARLSFLFVVAILSKSANGLSLVDRRQLFGMAASASLASVATIAPEASNAFDNRISTKYDDRPKQRGAQPRDLGVGTRVNFEGDEYKGLRNCGAAPNCFSSTMSDDPDHFIPAFEWPTDMDQAQAMQQLKQVLESYPPGQGGIDGGGFQFQKVSDSYIYIQFQSLKNGYIDDVEFAVIDGYPKSTIQLRSSSRLGYLDFGVNAKRVNWIASALKAKGWKAAGVDYDVHRGYVIENDMKL